MEDEEMMNRVRMMRSMGIPFSAIEQGEKVPSDLANIYSTSTPLPREYSVAVVDDDRALCDTIAMCIRNFEGFTYFGAYYSAAEILVGQIQVTSATEAM
jgi:hypothetical protein